MQNLILSHNDSYVSSALNSATASGDYTAANALGFTKFGDVFAEHTTGDWNITCSSSQNCVISCSCNEANEWYDSTSKTGANYISVSTNRSYAFTSSSSSASAANAKKTCYHAAPNCAEKGYSDTNLGAGLCKEIDLGSDGICYKCIDKIYFDMRTTISSGSYSYELYAGDTKATTDNGFSVPVAASTQPDFPTKITIKKPNASPADSDECSVTLAGPSQSSGYDTGSGTMTYTSDCREAGFIYNYVSSYSGPAYSGSSKMSLGTLTYHFANGKTISLRPFLTSRTCESFGLYASKQPNMDCTLQETEFAKCYQCFKHGSGGTGTTCDENNKVFFVTTTRDTYGNLSMTYALGCYTGGLVRTYMDSENDTLPSGTEPIWDVGYKTGRGEIAPQRYRAVWTHEAGISGSAVDAYPVTSPSLDLPSPDVTPPDLSIPTCAKVCHIRGSGYDFNACSELTPGYVKSTENYTFTTTSGRTLSLPVMMRIEQPASNCDRFTGIIE